jgi:hypothetical protein
MHDAAQSIVRVEECPLALQAFLRERGRAPGLRRRFIHATDRSVQGEATERAIWLAFAKDFLLHPCPRASTELDHEAAVT